MKQHFHRRDYVNITAVIPFSFLYSPNCCNQPSQSALDPLLSGLKISAPHCISHRAIVPKLFSSTDVLASYIGSDWRLFQSSCFIPSQPPQVPSILPGRAGEELLPWNCDARHVFSSRINLWHFLIEMRTSRLLFSNNLKHRVVLPP